MYFLCLFDRELTGGFQERKKEGDRWKVNNAGETMNGDDDEFDPNMRYDIYFLTAYVYGESFHVFLVK